MHKNLEDLNAQYEGKNYYVEKGKNKTDRRKWNKPKASSNKQKNQRISIWIYQEDKIIGW